MVNLAQVFAVDYLGISLGALIRLSLSLEKTRCYARQDLMNLRKGFPMREAADIESDLRHLTPSVRAAFRLTSERQTLDHLVGEIGLAGATSWQKGEHIARSDLQRRTNGWCFELPWQRTYMLDDALTLLLRALAPHRDEILAVTMALDLDAHFALETRMYENHVPAGYLSPANVKTIASYGASLDAGVVPMEVDQSKEDA